jgi:hypothetical protein
MPLLTLALSVLFLAIFPRQTCAGEFAIDFFDKHSLELAPQQDVVACWAAAMSAALKSKGVDLDQASIKIAVNGTPQAATLKDPRRLSGMLDRLPYQEGKLKTVSATQPAQWISWPRFKGEIEDGNPFVVGYWTGPGSAHVVVVYGAITNAYGIPVAYKIWDPLPGVGLRVAPVPKFNQSAWFFFILRDAELK